MPNEGEPYLSLTTSYSLWAPPALLGEINAVVTCGTPIDLNAAFPRWDKANCVPLLHIA